MSNSYIIDNTEGSVTFVIEPGTLDGPGGVNRNSDLYLYGQGSIKWGEGVNESLLRLSESFSCPQKTLGDFLPGGAEGNTDYDPNIHDTMPKNEADLGAVGLGITTPLNGQLWYNSTTDKLYVYDLTNDTWRTGSGLYVDTDPAVPVLGDLKYNSNFHGTGVAQLTVYDGASFISTSQEYVRLAGDTMTGHLVLNADPTIALHAVTKQYADNTFVDVAGDTMSGVLDMGTNLINNVTDPVSAQDAATKNYADTTFMKLDGSNPMSTNLDMGSNRVINVADPVNPQDAVTKNFVSVLLNAMFPVGDVRIGSNPTTALALAGLVSTWTQVPEGTFLMVSGGSAPTGTTGGTAWTGSDHNVTIAIANMPAHNHGGGNHVHNHEIGFGGGGTITRHSGQAASLLQGTINTGPSGTIISTQGSNTPLSITPQYEAVEVWKRTA